MPPFRDAVGLVDAQERGPRPFEQGSGRGQLECLGRSEDDQAAALLEGLKYRPALGGAQAAVKRDDGDAASLKRLLLIRHEGNERRDHNRRAIEDHRWNLIDQRFAKAGRQRDERVATVQNGEHGRFLLGPQALDTERAARRAAREVEQAVARARLTRRGAGHGQKMTQGG